MGLRFRKRVKIGKGVHLNINKNSIGLSAGVKGARVSVNSKGRKTTSVGIPGTGISYVTTENIGSKKPKSKPARKAERKKGIGRTVGLLLLVSGILALFGPDKTGAAGVIVLGIVVYRLSSEPSESN